MRILVVEDEPKVARFIQKGLREQNFLVDTASDGEEGLFLAESEHYDAVVLDIMLPKIDGFEVLRRLRRRNKKVPVICLTAKGKLEDKLEGFKAGSDDYLIKPFRFSELLARLRAVLKRSAVAESETELRYADLSLNLLTRQAARAGRSILLTSKEFNLLEYFMRHPEEVLTRTMIIESAWDYNSDLLSNVIDVHIKRLREKIEARGETPLIHTVRGMGYILKED